MSRRARPRIVIVVQRYGEAVVGGAESHARMLAQRLARSAEVTVLTSCASDWVSWRNTYPAGHSLDGAVQVHRHPVRTPRWRRVQFWCEHPRSPLQWRWIFRRIGPLYLRAQGPWAPGIVEEVDTIRCDRIIFFSCIYYPTVLGILRARRRGLPLDLVPTAHEDPPLLLNAVRDSVGVADRLALNTAAERDLVLRTFDLPRGRCSIVGCGTDFPGVEDLPLGPEDPRCAIEGDYMLYLGRHKDGVELLDALRDLPGCKLVCAGSARVEGAVNLGHVSAADKWWLTANATAAIQPSLRESLGLTLIEAWQVGVPVLANGDCLVLRRQVEQSGGGMLFTDRASLRAAARQLLGDEPLRRQLGQAGRAFAERYEWDAICEFYSAGL